MISKQSIDDNFINTLLQSYDKWPIEAVDISVAHVQTLFDSGSQQCESPIEFLLFMAISLVSVEWFGRDFKIYPQKRIARFRVDFLVSFNGKDVLVECDGHDFHEKTKDQAARDKQRDRLLQTLGFHVLRFTGSEIWDDCFRCAHEVFRCLYGGQIQ